MSSLRRICLIYLLLIPFLVFALAFAIGHSSYTVYLPVWSLHSCLMLLAIWILGAHAIGSKDPEKRNLVIIACFLVIPWTFISIFAGMGPLPATLQAWADTATEQHIRYIILLVVGASYAAGFALLRDKLRRENENLYSVLGYTGIMIKMPLYFFSMTWLSGYLIECLKIFLASGTDKRPDWHLAIRAQFSMISMIEVAATWLATAAFAASLRSTGWLRPASARVYVIISLFCCACSLIPGGVDGPLSVAGYLTSIPAFSLIIPYLFGLNFLRRAGYKF